MAIDNKVEKQNAGGVMPEKFRSFFTLSVMLSELMIDPLASAATVE